MDSNNRLKVLWIAPIPHPDAGYQHPAPWLAAMIDALSNEKEVELTIVSMSKWKELEMEDRGVKYVFLRSPRRRIDLLTLFSLRIRKLFNWVRNHYSEFDVIHVHGTEHQYEYGLWRLPIPVVISIQGLLTPYLEHYKLSQVRRVIISLGAAFERYAFKRNMNYLGRTEWDKEWVSRLNPKASYFYGPELLRAEFLTETMISPGGDIAFIGGTNELKDLPFALEVLQDLHKRSPDLRIHVVGHCHGEVLESIKRQETLCNLDWSKVELHGKLDSGRIIEVYRRCFCLLHPSRIDNSPNSIAEAQCIGLPVIATPVGGVPSMISHHETGFLAERRIESFVRWVEELKSFEGLWKRISEKSREAALIRHDPKEGVRKQVEIYNLVLQNFSG